MEADKEMLNRLLNEIQELVRENENEDGTYRFDLLKAVIALDFAKQRLKKQFSSDFSDGLTIEAAYAIISTSVSRFPKRNHEFPSFQSVN